MATSPALWSQSMHRVCFLHFEVVRSTVRSVLPTHPPLLGHSYFVFKQGSKIWAWTQKSQNWPPRMLRAQKHRRIRRLGDPSPMEDVPDQDSAKNLETQSWNFILLTRANLWHTRWWCISIVSPSFVGLYESIKPNTQTQSRHSP